MSNENKLSHTQFSNFNVFIAFAIYFNFSPMHTHTGNATFMTLNAKIERKRERDREGKKKCNRKESIFIRIRILTFLLSFYSQNRYRNNELTLV